MNITLNNRPEVLEGDEVTVTEMLEQKKYSFMMRLVKINGKLIKRENYDNTIINAGDDVQMLYLMSGG